MLDGTEAADRAQGRSEISMVARNQDATTARVKFEDSLALARREAVPDVDGEQPDLIERRLVEPAQHRIVVGRLAIARRHRA